jgi:hypothetical protein
MLMQELPFSWHWGEATAFGQTVVILIIIAWFFVKVAPMWKELKLREFSVREGEAKVGLEQAVALKSVGSSLEAMAGSLKGLGASLNNSTEIMGLVVVEQRRATEAVRIMQRVNAESTERLHASVQDLAARLARLEEMDERGYGEHQEKSGPTPH